MMLCILPKVICKVRPTTTYTNHHSLTFSYQTNKELNGLIAPRGGEMVELDFWL